VLAALVVFGGATACSEPVSADRSRQHALAADGAVALAPRGSVLAGRSSQLAARDSLYHTSTPTAVNARWRTAMATAEVLRYYQEELPVNGWTLDFLSCSPAGSFTLTASKRTAGFWASAIVQYGHSAPGSGYDLSVSLLAPPASRGAGEPPQPLGGQDPDRGCP